MSFKNERKIILPEKDMPQSWYNILVDIEESMPPALHPKTRKILTSDDGSKIVPQELMHQDFSIEKFIPIPQEVQDAYKLWRPTPLKRAIYLEGFLKTPAKIYYKDESVSPTGGFKLNTAMAQAYFSKKEGVKRLVSETGAGQWGSALAFACQFLGLGCGIYMVKSSMDQKPSRKSLMKIFGAEIFPSPSQRTSVGKNILNSVPDSQVSLGIACSEALEEAFLDSETKYSCASVANHVLLHQSIIGLETKKQFEMIEDFPDVIFGCVGGGSNFMGTIAPFLVDKKKGKNIEFIACESSACPSLTQGRYSYDYSDTNGLLSIIKMYTVGHGFMPSSIHAGGLRYHGCSPVLSYLVNKKMVSPVAFSQGPVFEAALLFAKTEGLLPSPETGHAIQGAIQEAIKCRETKKEKCILIGFSGHGNFDLSAYEDYLSQKLEEEQVPQSRIQKALEELPHIE